MTLDLPLLECKMKGFWMSYIYNPSVWIYLKNQSSVAVAIYLETTVRISFVTLTHIIDMLNTNYAVHITNRLSESLGEMKGKSLQRWHDSLTGGWANPAEECFEAVLFEWGLPVSIQTLSNQVFSSFYNLVCSLSVLLYAHCAIPCYWGS